MLASPVARVYAEALFAIAQERGQVDDLGEELHDFVALLNREKDVVRFLESPVIEATEKARQLKGAMVGRTSDIVVDFVSLLVERGRVNALPSIDEAYRAMADEHAGRAHVSVQSATPFPDALQQELEAVLWKNLNKKVAIEAEVEPALLGGAVITVGDKVYDGSIRNRLSQFRKQITRSGGYEDQG